MAMSPNRLRHYVNWWGPYLGSAIKVTHIDPLWQSCRVELRRRWYNANYVGTHFGGSLFAMTDPWWMILVMENLGRDYIVWDKAAEIEFVAARKETVHAEFRVDPAAVAELRTAAAGGEKVLRWFDVEVRTAAGEVVAKVRKQLHVRLKRPKPA